MSAPCDDCGVDTAPLSPLPGEWEWYMVRDAVWAAAGMPTADPDEAGPPLPGDGRGFLCVGCLEARLGRRLAPADFTDAPVNWQPTPGSSHADRRSERLAARLAA